MNSLLLDATVDGLGVLMIVGIVALVVVAAFGAVSLFASIWRWVLVRRYKKYNKQTVSTGLTGGETAVKLLEGLGITDVEVVKCNFFSAMFLGNGYSPFKKRIRLRKNIYNATTLTAVAVATQKVALAHRDHEGDKKIKARGVFTTLGYFSPFAVVPLVIVGLIIDLLASQGLGVATIVFTCFAVVFYLASFVVVCLNMSIEKRASNTAIEFMEKTNLLNKEEIEDARELYKTYITLYVLDFVSELLYLLWTCIKLFGLILKAAAKK